MRPSLRARWNATPPRVRWGAVGLAALVVAAVVLLAAFLLTRSSGPPKPTIWAAIMSQVEDGHVPKDAALEAFSLAFQVDIPGVHLPDGVHGDDVPRSASGVSRWVMRHWAELTPDQQAVIARYVELSPDQAAASRHVTGRLPVYLAAARGFPAPDSATDIGVPGIPTDNCNRPVDLDGNAPPDVIAAVRADVLADIARIGPRLGIPVIQDTTFSRNITVAFSDADGGNTLFNTHPLHGAICPYSPCNIVVFQNTWSKETPSGGKVSDPMHVLLTHEVLHCYMNVIWGDVDTALSMPAWITEGGALWLAADDTKLIETNVPSSLKEGYFFNPEQALTNRNYDAYGYYALLDHLGRPLWSLMKPAWEAAVKSPTNRSDPYIAVLNGDASDVRTAWAPSYLRQNDWHDPWIAYAFGLPDDAQVLRRPLIAPAEPPALGSLQSRSNSIRSVEAAEGDVVHVDVFNDGIGNAHDEQGHDDRAWDTRRFCVAGTCICPPNTTHAGEDMADGPMTIPFVLAINAPNGGANYQIYARKLDDECGKPRPTPKPGTGGGGDPCGSGGCGGSNGDPHLLTIDRVAYDFQAAGEFTLLRSPDASLEIQARQEPYLDQATNQPSASVSVNTAVAARVNGHRVSIYDRPGGQEIRVDGTTRTDAAVDLGGGASVVVHRRGAEVDFPDGTILWALRTGGYGINAQVRPSDALRGNAVGMLGVVPRGGFNVPALPDGTKLPAPIGRQQRHEVLYGRFADAWRVTDATTLFDYDPGRSTASYTVAGFPSADADRTLEDLAADARAYSAAVTACDVITDAALRNQCIYDVVVTANAGFVTGYQQVTQFRTVGATSLDEPVPTQPPASFLPQPTPTLAGRTFAPAVSGVKRLHGQVLGPDGTLYLAVEQAGPAFQILAVDPLQGRVLRTKDGVGNGSVLFAAGSLWAVEGGGAVPCTVTRLDPATFAVQASNPGPCSTFGFGPPPYASSGDAIWFYDSTGADAQGKGAHLRRVDPATGQPAPTSQPGAAVELPFLNGYLRSSGTTIYYGDPSTSWYRLAAGGTSFQDLGPHPNVNTPSPDGWWGPAQNGSIAELYAGPGGATRTVAIDGTLVGADGSAVYSDRQLAPDYTDSLWRYGRDGGTPTALLPSVNVTVGSDSRPLSYTSDDPLLIGDRLIVKIWFVVERAENPQTAIFVAAAPLP